MLSSCGEAVSMKGHVGAASVRSVGTAASQEPTVKAGALSQSHRMVEIQNARQASGMLHLGLTPWCGLLCDGYHIHLQFERCLSVQHPFQIMLVVVKYF